MTAGLTLGDLDLMGDGQFRLEALGTDSGTDWGNPAPIESQLNSFLQYGSLVVSEGWENMPVMVAISAVDSDPIGLADAAAALGVEVGKPNWLVYTPEGSDISTCFEVRASHFDVVPDDLREVLETTDVYMLNLTCAPFKFSAEETFTQPFTPPSSVTSAVVSDGTSTAGWVSWDELQATVAESLAVVSGAVVNASTVSVGLGQSFPSTFVTGAFRNGTIDTSATKYIAIDQRVEAFNGWGFSNVRVLLDGVSITPLSVTGLPSGFYRIWVQAPGTSVNSVAVIADVKPVSGRLQSVGVAAKVTFDQIIRSNSYSQVSTTKQLLRDIEVGGSAPTIGSVVIEHETSALGDVLFYSCLQANGYLPAFRNRRNGSYAGSHMAANATADPTAVSGFYDVLDGTTSDLWFDAAIDSMPDGEYLLMARMTASSGSSLRWYAGTTMAGALMAGGDWDIDTIAPPTSSEYKFVRLGMTHLPTAQAGTSGRCAFVLERLGGTMQIDDFYAFNLTTGRLTQVACGTGSPAPNGPSKRLWIDSPSLDNGGLGGMMRGHSADRADAISAFPSAVATGIHEFAPPAVTTFAVTTGADSASIGFRHRKAWMHTAAE